MTDSTASWSRRRPAFLGMLAVLVLALSGGLVAACGGGANPTLMAAMPTKDASEAPAMTMSAT
ncbi:MAG TPA: hypothetical protein VHN80_30845, partial [Kineosporiaceae bacterium]|nr:hypothetical protein [Kineosporiaceae bacterium]